MRFTVLVAVYNAAEWLPRCLDSLLSQTEQSVEVLCIDDCSSDTSADVIREYAQRDSRVVYLRTPQNSGQAVARNLGLEHAHGTLTTMVDADDWLAPDSLERLWEGFNSDPEADAVAFRLIYTDCARTWEDPAKQGVDLYGASLFPLPAERPTAFPALDGREACRLAIDWRLHGYYAIRTELHRRLPYDTTCRLYSDDNTSRLHYLHCRKVVLTDAIYYYRQHPANSTRQLTRRRFDFMAANDSLRASLERYGADADMLSVCEEYVWRNYVGLWRQAQGPCNLSDEERAEVDGLFRTSYALIHRRRLKWRTMLRPCFIPWPSYRIFCAWQRVLM